LRDAIATDYKANLEDLFLHFHANPELPNREFKTTKTRHEKSREYSPHISAKK